MVQFLMLETDKMAARNRPKLPSMLLIFCEGKTEAAYFNILTDFYRLPRSVTVEVFGQQNQHFALIDNAVKKRAEYCAADKISEEDVECWAVCDEDFMSVSFSELAHYAQKRNVLLAFSAPQFEMYLLQHFEQSGETRKEKVFHRLSTYRIKNGGEGEYNDSTKADLSWMSTAIDNRPKIIRIAITNSDLRTKATKKPFFTVQNLTKRIVDMSL